MDSSCELLQMTRELGFTYDQMAKEVGVSLSSFNRYVRNGAPDRVMNAAYWIYYKRMEKPFSSTCD